MYSRNSLYNYQTLADSSLKKIKAKFVKGPRKSSANKKDQGNVLQKKGQRKCSAKKMGGDFLFFWGLGVSHPPRK